MKAINLVLIKKLIILFRSFNTPLTWRCKKFAFFRGYRGILKKEIVQKVHEYQQTWFPSPRNIVELTLLRKVVYELDSESTHESAIL